VAVIGFFLEAIGQILHMIVFAYMIVVVVAAIITWFEPNPYNPLVQILKRLTEPVYRWMRFRFPFVVVAGVDLAPMVMIIFLQFIDLFVVRTLIYFARSLGV
jgi:YggT family protein